MLNSYFKTSRKYSLSFCLLALLAMVSCQDIVEIDLDGELVELISPPDLFDSPSGTIEFNWSAASEADRYRLQVVRPTFDSVVSIRLDTLLSGSSFQHSFAPGVYQWRLRGENTNSASNWSARSFSIDSLIDISSVQIQLLSPIQNFVTSSDSSQFSWVPINGADDYRFTIYEDDLNGPIYIGPITTAESGYIADLDEGNYAWTVQGISAVANSEISFRSLTIDRSPPSSSQLIYPESFDVIPPDTIFSFDWISGIDILTEVVDSLFIYDDDNEELLYQLVETDLQVNTDTLPLPTYHWEVRSYDEANNVSVSLTRQFNLE